MNESLDEIETPRMVGRRLTPDHLSLLMEMHRDVSVMSTLGGLKDDEQTRAYLQENLDHWDQHGYGLWMFYDRTDDVFVGRGYLRNKCTGDELIGIGYALLKHYWGRGMATEMAREFVQIGFDIIGLEELFAASLPHNCASRHVLEKIGFTFERDIVYKGLPHARYCITRDTWSQSHGD